MTNLADRAIWTGDSLDIVRGLNSASVDLIYLDPSFNSNRNYAAPVGSAAAGAAFKVTWTLIGRINDQDWERLRSRRCVPGRKSRSACRSCSPSRRSFSAVSIIAVGYLGPPDTIPEIPFPETLQTDIHPVSAQVLVQPARRTVYRRNYETQP